MRVTSRPGDEPMPQSTHSLSIDRQSTDASATQPTLAPCRVLPGPSRRALVTTAAWAAPVIATAIATPLASASGETPPVPITSDIALSYSGGTTGSTDDISNAVILWIKQALLDLGPKVPPAPEEPTPPAVPGNDPIPLRNQFPTGAIGELRYQAAVAAWQLRNPGLWDKVLEWRIEQAKWVADYAKWAAENAEAITQRTAWEIAIGQLERMMRELEAIGKMLFSVSISYPRYLVATNNGPNPILPGSVVTVSTTVDSNLINVHLPETGGVAAIQTGGTTTLSFIATETIPAGSVVFTQPLSYNPASVTLNISGTTTNSSVASQLDPLDQDTSLNGNIVSAPIGVTLNVLTGDLQEVLARWEKLTSQVEDLKKIWDLISPYIDWQQIISGVLPLPQRP